VKKEKIMARPKKEASERATESFVVRLNNDDSKILSDYANSLKTTLSSAITKIVAENKCFDYDIDDDMYAKILSFSENGQAVPRSIVASELKIVRCWITKREKRSLLYCATIKHSTSLSVFVNSLLKDFIANIKQVPQKTENNADVLIKDLWQYASDKTKKELVEEYMHKKGKI